MRLITWNCQGAFRKKADSILKLQPDILVVQECEHPDKLKFSEATKKPNSIYWYGDNVNKSIGVFSYSDYQFELMPEFNPEYRYILPFKVTGKGHTFIFFAVWAMNNKENYEARYIGQIWLAIDLLSPSTLLIGDFNRNKIWDYKDRVGSHSDVVSFLARKNILSVYHTFYDEEQGKETRPTFFLHKKDFKPYHIDYCFVSSDLYEKVKDVEVGSYESWIAYSDHSPLSITINL